MELDLRADGLFGGYGKNVVVKDLSFHMEAGDVLAVLGPNGCGKSTLIKLLLRFLPRAGGKVFCGGEDVFAMSRRRLAQVFSYIPQSDNMMFAYTAGEMVTMARTGHLPPLGSPSAADEALAVESMRQLKIDHLADRLYNTLSGGQRQLVLIARALCQKTCVMMMDEPTANLDFYNQKLVLDAIRYIAGSGKMVLITTHSPSQPFAVANKALLMSGGAVKGYGATEDVLTASRLEEVFGVSMDVLSVTDRKGGVHRISVTM